MIIRLKDKERIISLAREYIKQICKILAYGSRVNGEAHDTSDLDLVIVTKNDEKVNRSEFLSFIEALQNSNIPIFVQVLDWNRIPESFHKNILVSNEELVSIGSEKKVKLSEVAKLNN